MSTVEESVPNATPANVEEANPAPSDAELRTLVEKLALQHNESLKQLAALQAQQNQKSVTRLVVPRERKIKRFSGAPETVPTVEDFVEEVRSIFKAPEMPPNESLDFILSYLDNSYAASCICHSGSGEPGRGHPCITHRYLIISLLHRSTKFCL